MKGISKKSYIGSMALGNVLSLTFAVVFFVFYARGDTGSAWVAYCFCLASGLFAGIVMLILLHKMWAAIQDGQVRTTPAKAVGFLFVPVFNIYWLFQAFWGWTKDYNRFVSDRSLDAPRMPEGLALAFCVLTLIPGLNFLAFIVMLLLLAKACDGVNALLEAGVSRAAATVEGRGLVIANVFVASVLVLGLVGAVNYIANWFKMRYSLTADLTEGRRYSFSERTRLLLKRLDREVRLTSLFVANEKDEVGQLRKRRVEELVQQYAAGSGRVEIEYIDPQENPAPLQELVRRITLARTLKPGADGKVMTAEEAAQKGVDKETYADLEKTYKLDQTIARFLALEKDLSQVMTTDQRLFQEAANTPGLSAQAKDFFLRVAASLEGEQRNLEAFGEVLKTEFGWLLEALNIVPQGVTVDKAKEMSLMIPGYVLARNTMSDRVDSAAQLLDGILSIGQRMAAAEGAKLPETATKLLEQAQERYKPLQERLAQFSETLNELNDPAGQTIELEKLRDDLKYLNSVVVEVGPKVRVLGADDIWPVASGHSRWEEDAPRAFLGEEAVSGAILGMTSKERPAAVFVKWGAMPVSENIGAYTELARQVSRNNFIIANWNLQQQPEMPKIEGMSKAVLVVLPPDPPNPQMFTMPPGPEAYEPVRKFIEEGGSALFFVRVNFGPMTPRIPYLDMLKDFGIAVNNDVATVFAVTRPDGSTVLQPYLETTRYPSIDSRGPVHPIVAPLQGMKSLLIGAVVVKAVEPLPSGVRAWPLIETPDRSDYWGESDVEQLGRKRAGQFDATSPGPGQPPDVAAPYPVALAVSIDRAAEPPATPDDAKESAKTESRLVVFGDDAFITDQFFNVGAAVTPQGLVILENPANGELAVNSLLWLAHQEDMISVGPKAQQARRIGDIAPATYTALRAVVWGLLPLMIIALGIVVYAVRTRKR